MMEKKVIANHIPVTENQTTTFSHIIMKLNFTSRSSRPDCSQLYQRSGNVNFHRNSALVLKLAPDISIFYF